MTDERQKVPGEFEQLRRKYASLLEECHQQAADKTAAQAEVRRLRAELKLASECEEDCYQGNVEVAKALGLEVWGTDELGPAVSQLKDERDRAAADMRDRAATAMANSGYHAQAAIIRALPLTPEVKGTP